MAERVRVPRTAPPPAAVESGAEFQGLVLLQGSGRIEGRVEGGVIATGTLWVGSSGSIVGPVAAENAILAGRVEGEVRASGRIAVEPTAQIRGDLTAQRLVLAEGSFVEGACHAGKSGVAPDSD